MLDVVQVSEKSVPECGGGHVSVDVGMKFDLNDLAHVDNAIQALQAYHDGHLGPNDGCTVEQVETERMILLVKLKTLIGSVVDILLGLFQVSWCYSVLLIISELCDQIFG